MGAGGRPGLSLWSLAAVSRAHLVAAILGVRLQDVGDAVDSLLVSIMPSMQSTARLDVDQEVVAHDSDFLLSGLRTSDWRVVLCVRHVTRSRAGAPNIQCHFCYRNPRSLFERGIRQMGTSLSSAGHARCVC